jgi:hypothetical protein
LLSNALVTNKKCNEAIGVTLFFLVLEIMFRSRCHRPQTKPNSIEYHISSSEISFLLLSSLSSQPVNKSSTQISPHSNASLITFPPDATLKLILSQKSFINLAAKHSSTSGINTDEQHIDAHFELQGKILDDNLQFSSISLKKELVLVIDDNIRLKFHESKRINPNSTVLNEHRKGLFHRLPMDNGHRHKSSQQTIYPNESLDLLFDTLHGELSYLTEYLKSHVGERHKFTIYPIQQQKQSKSNQWNEWETGIYKMSGDTNGTVNIALAADWWGDFLSSFANTIHFLIGVLVQWNQHLLRVQ